MFWIVGMYCQMPELFSYFNFGICCRFLHQITNNQLHLMCHVTSCLPYTGTKIYRLTGLSQLAEFWTVSPGAPGSNPAGASKVSPLDIASEGYMSLTSDSREEAVIPLPRNWLIMPGLIPRNTGKVLQPGITPHLTNKNL